MVFEELLRISPYSLNKTEKEKLLTDRLSELTRYHRRNCPEYADILNMLSFGEQETGSYKDLPFLPVRLFKELTLRSVPAGEIIKTMTSSGTTGQRVSQIYLDRATASNQQKAMVKIVNAFTGSSSDADDHSRLSFRGEGPEKIFGQRRGNFGVFHLWRKEDICVQR